MRECHTPAVLSAGVSFAPPWSLSPSACSSFKECPLAFRFSYIERLPEPPSHWTTKGTLVHRALELLLDRPADERTHRRRRSPTSTAPGSSSPPHPDFTDLVLTDEEWAQFHADSELLVRRYFELEDPRTVRPIGLELKLEADLGKVRLRGVIDRLELDEHGELVVTDYKTGSVPSELWEAKSLSGVHMYALLCERTFGKRPARVQLFYLSKPEAIIATPSDQSITGGRAQDRGDVVGDRDGVRARRLPPAPGAAVRLLHVQALLPGARGRPARRRRAPRSRAR